MYARVTASVSACSSKLMMATTDSGAEGTKTEGVCLYTKELQALDMPHPVGQVDGRGFFCAKTIGSKLIQSHRSSLVISLKGKYIGILLSVWVPVSERMNQQKAGEHHHGAGHPMHAERCEFSSTR